MIAVFCRYQRDFDDISATPRKMFRRISKASDVRGLTFTGVIHLYDWYSGDIEVIRARNELYLRQPELFDK